MTATLAYDDYKRTRFFTALDGIRALSVVLVIVWHMPEKDVLGKLNGWTGVSMFFVLSGFLITTLCLREAQRGDGRRFDLAAFYIRRVHRILPLYVLTVLLAAVTIAAWSLIGPWDQFERTIAYYLTMSVDVIPNRQQPLLHTWSLGIEEKFYVLWPLLLFALLRASKGTRVVVTGAMVVFANLVPSAYLNLYLPITLGCFLAFVLDHERIFGWMASRPDRQKTGLLWVALLVTAVMQIVVKEIPRGYQLYAYVAFGVIGLVILTPWGTVSRFFSTAGCRWIGRRSYGIYLLHPFVIHAIDRGIAPDSSSVPSMAVRLVLAFAGSFLVADLAHRFVEVPMIRRGHRIVKERQARREATPVASATPAVASGNTQP